MSWGGAENCTVLHSREYLDVTIVESLGRFLLLKVPFRYCRQAEIGNLIRSTFVGRVLEGYISAISRLSLPHDYRRVALAPSHVAMEQCW